MMTLANFENRDAFGANGFQNAVVLQLLSFVIVCYHFLLHEECNKFFDSEWCIISSWSSSQETRTYFMNHQLLAGVPCILPTSSQSGSGQLPHCREHSVRCVSTSLHSLLAFLACIYTQSGTSFPFLSCRLNSKMVSSRTLLQGFKGKRRYAVDFDVANHSLSHQDGQFHELPLQAARLGLPYLLSNGRLASLNTVRLSHFQNFQVVAGLPLISVVRNSFLHALCSVRAALLQPSNIFQHLPTFSHIFQHLPTFQLHKTSSSPVGDGPPQPVVEAKRSLCYHYVVCIQQGRITKVFKSIRR